MHTTRWIVVAGLVASAAPVWAAERGVKSGAEAMAQAKGQAGVKAPAAVAGAGEYDFGDFSSETLVGKAWKALEAGDHAGVDAYAGKCISLYEKQADQQAQSLSEFASKDKAFSYWALNDVGVAHFVLGQARLAQGKVKDAQEHFQTVIDRYPYAQCWDPQGWFWKVAEASSDKLSTIGTAYDFGDYTSQTLTTKAWEALNAGDYKGVEIYTKKTVQLYEGDAKKMQSELTEFLPKDKAFNAWALNDVGTSYFVLGEALLAQKRYDEAKGAYERVVNDFGFAQCWDPKGWFWKPAVAARGKLNKILVEQGG